MANAVVVVGSLNMDFVATVERLPAPGETVIGSRFTMTPGGKGANQACAAAGLGASTALIGRVGNDVFGDQLKAGLAAAGVDVSFVQTSRPEATGAALIWVDAAGQNSIVVAPGANRRLARGDVGGWRRVFRGAKVALFQLETPIRTVDAALGLAREEGLITILDPAPAAPLPRPLLDNVDILTPNESEALQLAGRPRRQNWRRPCLAWERRASSSSWGPAGRGGTASTSRRFPSRPSIPPPRATPLTGHWRWRWRRTFPWSEPSVSPTRPPRFR